jgi:hypothetical protein
LQPAGGPSPAGAKFPEFLILNFGFSIVSQPRSEVAKSKIFNRKSKILFTHGH